MNKGRISNHSKDENLLYYLGNLLTQTFGPMRLFTSHMILAGIGLMFSWVLTAVLLPKLMGLLPTDRGREHAVGSKASVGKPTGAGIIFISIFLVVQLFVLPPSVQVYWVLALTTIAMLAGFFDDKSLNPWGEYTKGAIDLVIAALAAGVLCQWSAMEIWLPLTKDTFLIPAWIFIPFGTVLVWTTINATNCSDGVDGLSGTLTIIAFASLGALLYFALGHQDIAGYLLIPNYNDGATWGILSFSIVGALVGYLWYNAHPSQLLMGDAGSRALGFLLGVLVLKCGNPFVVFIVSGVLLVNGGTGLIKLALLRFLKVSIFSSVRFPLHDHVRHKLGWSNTQVLVRFSVLQAMLTLILFVILVKVR